MFKTLYVDICYIFVIHFYIENVYIVSNICSDIICVTSDALIDVLISQ